VQESLADLFVRIRVHPRRLVGRVGDTPGNYVGGRSDQEHHLRPPYLVLPATALDERPSIRHIT